MKLPLPVIVARILRALLVSALFAPSLVRLAHAAELTPGPEHPAQWVIVSQEDGDIHRVDVANIRPVTMSGHRYIIFSEQATVKHLVTGQPVEFEPHVHAIDCQRGLWYNDRHAPVAVVRISETGDGIKAIAAFVCSRLDSQMLPHLTF